MEQPADTTNTTNTTNTTDTASTDSAGLLRQLSNQMADAVERISASLVLVNGRERQPASGVAYAPDLVLTAAHVIERSEGITIYTSDQRTLPAQLVGRDPNSDLAVLRVTDAGLTPATPSPEAARVGQMVLATGFTNEEGLMASSGVVSALGGPLRTRGGLLIERYIRTDAIPYPGFSGGALIDTRGSLLGLLTTGLIQSIALAIPTDIAKGIADTLTTQGHIKRGFLGISSQLVQVPAAQRTNSTQEYGLLIVKVDDDSPAQKGGILLGDILVTLDGRAIKDSEDLQLLLTGERVGKAVPVEVIRGSALKTLSITIGERR
ncbi:MAG TPA: trypsin-like peptidase domain-containing protein [Ktedonobacteraceae bacterium]|nr:trypsin-like peptidase domain-containing protein [Ktedonobacteraceae bacterium]